MLSLYRTLSLRYLSRRWVRALLIVVSIALGVLTLVCTRALSDTMAKASLGTSNPIAGQADFVVSNGEFSFSEALGRELTQVAGVKTVRPRIFGNAKLVKPDAVKDSNVLIMGIDLEAEMTDEGGLASLTLSDDVKGLLAGWNLSKKSRSLDVPFFGNPFANFLKQPIAVVGFELDQQLPPGKPIEVRKNADSNKRTVTVLRAGWVKGSEHYAVLSGYVLVTSLEWAEQILELAPGQISRLDVFLTPGAARAQAREDIARIVGGRAKVSTPGEQDDSLHSVMDGMRVGFTLGGMAALVVALFLVYMSLSVSVAERRHEIGILKALGATQNQILVLFAGEAMLLGLVGSLIGAPLGYLAANLSLAPMQDVVKDIFGHLDARQVDFSWPLMIVAVLTGKVTAMAASLAPAFAASRENPAEAIRRVVKPAGTRHLITQAAISVAMIGAGVLAVMCRGQLPLRWGSYGGLIAVLLGALIACPLYSALLTRMLHPLIRTFLGVEWRLAADNLVRSPARTGLVIGALAAGVALVVQTTGLIRSNRIALREWVQDSIAADLIVTAGSPVGAGGRNLPLPPSVGDEFKSLPEVEAALPVRFRRVSFRDTIVFLAAVDATRAYQAEKTRLAKTNEIELYKAMANEPGTVIVSDNFVAKQGLGVGDTVTLLSDGGEVHLKIIGQIPDFSWNTGSLFINRPDFLRYWQDDKVDVFDIYLRPGVDPIYMKDRLNNLYGTRFELFVSTRAELQTRIDDMIGGLYGIAYAQQIIVILVAALGVVTALLISVLQRRREMGLLRAIGASQGQVIYSVLAEACLMGIIGTAIGLAVGVPFQWFVLQVIIFEESGFLFPVYVPWLGGLVVAVCSMLVATIAGLGPAVYAVRTRIPEAIAYE